MSADAGCTACHGSGYYYLDDGSGYVCTCFYGERLFPRVPPPDPRDAELATLKAERDALQRAAENLEGEAVAAIDKLITDLAHERAKNAELEAQCAVMRKAMEAVIDEQGIDHEDDDCPMDDCCECSLIKTVNDAFRSTAGTDLLAALTAADELARIVDLTVFGDFMEHPDLGAKASAALAAYRARRGGSNG